MRHMRVWADTHSTGIIDEDGAPVRREDTMITDTTWAELQRWVEDYDYVIPLGAAARENLGAEIRELDQRGLRLLEKIQAEWAADRETGEPIEFQYFSEGLFRTLTAESR